MADGPEAAAGLVRIAAVALVAVISGRRTLSVLRFGRRDRGRGNGACSAERGVRTEALERDGERLGPWPVAVELEAGSASVTHELAGRSLSRPVRRFVSEFIEQRPPSCRAC